jgi:hypothetical protein
MKGDNLKKTLLVIDDDRVFGGTVRDFLSSDTVEVMLAHKAYDGLTLCSLRKIDVSYSTSSSRTRKDTRSVRTS